MTSGLFNEPLRSTRSGQSAPKILEMRQQMYEYDSLHPHKDHWNPAERLVDMQANYNRLVGQLGVSPRGPKPGRPVGRLPRVPGGPKTWESGSKSARNFGGRKMLLPAARGAGAGEDEADRMDGSSGPAMVVAWARVLSRLDSMMDDGRVSSEQVSKIKNLAELQEALVAKGGGGEDASLLAACQRLLSWLDAPDNSPPQQEGVMDMVAPADANELEEAPSAADIYEAVSSPDSAPAAEELNIMAASTTQQDETEPRVPPTPPRGGNQKEANEKDKKMRQKEKTTGAKPVSREAIVSSQAERAARAAAQEDLTEADMAQDGVKVALAKAELQLRHGRLPSLSPDDEDLGPSDHAQRSRKEANADSGSAWGQIEAKVAPGGVSQAPRWQRNVLARAQWQVEVRRSSQKAAFKKAAQEKAAATGDVPFWGAGRVSRPSASSLSAAPPRRMRLLEKELKRQQAEESDGSAVGGSGELKLFDASGEYHSWLRENKSDHQRTVLEVSNRIAVYESAIQQLVLERQELTHALEETKSGIAHIEDEKNKGDSTATSVWGIKKRERLKRELVNVSSRVNDMHTSTNQITLIINSLRNSRKGHLEALADLDDKEKQLDADGAVLLASAHAALEEHDRVRAKQQRMKHESNGVHTFQLKEAAGLQELLQSVDESHEELQQRLEDLDEKARRLQYSNVRGGRESAERRMLKHGHLKSQVAGWAHEFQRITEMTGVAFSDGKRWDAVEKVVAIYREKETRNASLLKLVNEDLMRTAEQLEAELSALRDSEAAMRERCRVDELNMAAASAVRMREEAQSAQQSSQAEYVQHSLASVLPAIESLSTTMGLEMPDHVKEKGCTLTTLNVYLALIEENLHELQARAQQLDPDEEDHNAWVKQWAGAREISHAPVIIKIRPKDAEEIMALEEGNQA